MKLSVLDQSIAVADQEEDAAIRDTLELAPYCESLGYHRFWLSEHHSLPTIVGTAPEILLAAIAARTRRIRLGSAGVMLPHYSALKVAEQFRVLEALAPGRIDLGVGRAPGADMQTAVLLNPNAYAAAEMFPEQVRDLHAWTSGMLHRGVVAHPRGPAQPEIWILAARITAHSWRRIWVCRTRSRISSATVKAPRKRCICTARTTGRVRAIRTRRQPCVLGACR